ncbi:hypothetical protein ACFVQ3_18590 [Oerskovia sp. NPDC057915]|uniref:hypothetical protein n=1 Tax=Oerskovia sp. NPDC057915 TaxID=3346280 RepID=UPI0036D8D835
MTAQTFHVEGLDGITFTPTYDVSKKWLVIEGHDRDGDLVSRSAFSVTPDPIDSSVEITPEPDGEPSPDLHVATETFVRAAKAEPDSGGDDGSQ